MNRNRLARWLYPTLGFLLLSFSLYILNRELSRYKLQDILISLALISDRQLVSAFLFAILGCFVISSYEYCLLLLSPMLLATLQALLY